MRRGRRWQVELRGALAKGWGVSDVWQAKDLQTTILEVWQAKDLAVDFVDVWQVQDLAAFLKEADVCLGRIRKTAWRGDIK